jgi:hypothetical protein
MPLPVLLLTILPPLLSETANCDALINGHSKPAMRKIAPHLVSATDPAGSTLYSLPIARGFTRLSTCYFSFWDGTGKFVNTFTLPVRAAIDNTDTTTDTDQRTWDIFSHHVY